MTAKTTSRKQARMFHCEELGVQRFGKKERNDMKKVARELFYHLVNPDIFDEIDGAATEMDAERLLINCRKAVV